MTIKILSGTSDSAIANSLCNRYYDSFVKQATNNHLPWIGDIGDCLCYLPSFSIKPLNSVDFDFQKTAYLANYENEVSRIDTNEPAEIAEPVFIAANRLSESNYFHWMQTVYSLFQQRHLSQHQRASSFLCDWNRFSYQKQWLDLLCIDKKTLISSSSVRSNSIRVRNMIVSDVLYKPFDNLPPPSIIMPLKKYLNQQVSKLTHLDRLPKRIFISRSDSAKKRGIHNVTEIQEALEKHGFTSVSLSSLSVVDQLALFFGADLIVSSHGAGLVNMIASNDTTRIFEIGNISYPNHCFCGLALACSLKDYTSLYYPEIDFDGLTDQEKQFPWRNLDKRGGQRELVSYVSPKSILDMLAI